MSGSNAPGPIESSPDRRKLVAVMYADMVGYSRLIGLDDAGTLQRLRTLRSRLIDPAVEQHGGRVVQTGGDSLLVVFDSIDGAVRCAVKVQREVPNLDGEQPPDRAIRFRVGISLGDAIADGTDLHGNAVNIAARLQAECPPGGICVSRSVRDHVHDRLDLAFDDLGILNLKNIARPVEAFLAGLSATTKVPGSVERALVHGTGEALPLPDKPSIAVLAFTNMSGDPEQEYFSDGIADDIVTELARSRSLFVIARNSSFSYKGRTVDIKQVARELGVRYVLEGSVRRSGSRVRVVAQLIDAETGNHIWAERYDRPLEDVFAVQDEITLAIVTAAQPAITDAEYRRILRKPSGSLDAWEAYKRGLWHVSRVSPTDNAQARAFFERAIELDPVFAPAYAAMARQIDTEGARWGTRSPKDALQIATEWAQRAVAIDPNDADARATLARLLFSRRNRRESWGHASLALASNPNSPWANCVAGTILVHDGRASEARNLVMAALRLDPRNPYYIDAVIVLIVACYFERDYHSALDTARHAAARYPKDGRPHLLLAATLGQLDHVGAAHEALQRAMTFSPGSFDTFVPSCPAWWRPEDHEHLLEGLRKAGWQG